MAFRVVEISVCGASPPDNIPWSEAEASCGSIEEARRHRRFMKPGTGGAMDCTHL